MAGWAITWAGALMTVFASAAREPEPLPAQGDALRDWLDLQRNAPAPSTVPVLPPGVAERIYERYLNSFSHPLPESFERQRIVEQE